MKIKYVRFEKYIIENIYDTLFPINSVSAFNTMNRKYGYRFFCSDLKNKNGLIKNLTELSDSINNYSTYSIVKIDKNRIYITYGKDGIYDLLLNLKHNSSDEFLLMDIETSIYSILRSEYNNSIKKYKITSTSYGFDLNEKIKPIYAIFGSNNELYELPDYPLYIKESIIISPKGNIASVKLYGGIRHPNSDDNNYYCVGDISDKIVSDGTLESLIYNISIFNLNSCYYIPDDLLSIIKGK